MEMLNKILEKIIEIFTTPLATAGGITLTLGYITLLLIRWFVPKNKIINRQDMTIAELVKENNQLKEINSIYEARIETLESKIDVVLNNSTNKKIKSARTLKIEPSEAKKLSIAPIDDNQKKIKVKVVKKNGKAK